MFLVSAAVWLLVDVMVLSLLGMILMFQSAYICEIALNSPVEHQRRMASPPQRVSADVEKGSSAQQDEAASSRELLILQCPSLQLPPATTNAAILPPVNYTHVFTMVSVDYKYLYFI